MLLLSAVFLTAAAGGLLYLRPYFGETVDPALLELSVQDSPAELLAYEPSNRPDRTGELHPAEGCGIPQPRRRVFTPLEEMPEELIHAFIAIEDKRFYRHKGVDPRRTAGALLGYLNGDPSFGGSTLTQQLVKNLTGDDEATPQRKLREIFRALELERRVGKERILEVYLNVINLAEGCYGVGAAADTYFSKTAAELTPDECASIAAITQNPARYDPITHPENNRRRRDLILSEMVAQGYLTPEEGEAAMSRELTLTPRPREAANGVTGWYADTVIADVIRDLQVRLGYSSKRAAMTVYNGGITVEIAMDETLQAELEAYFADPTHFPEGDAGRPQASAVVIDPYTGDILAIAGAVGAKTGNRLQSYASDTYRPAGSCIKPITVYAPAVELLGLTWAGIYLDEPVSGADQPPWPANADGLYRGRVTVGDSLAYSRNPVAVRILEEVGAQNAFDFAREGMGLRSLRSPDEAAAHDLTVSSLAMGQQSRGVTVRELTGAYAAFTDGLRKEPVTYHRVLDREGHVLLENSRPAEADRVLSPDSARLMTAMLSEVTAKGTAARYMAESKKQGLDTAGKTGTTQNNCDRWFIGYTPRLLCGVWMGYDYPRELRGIDGNPCAGIWDHLMSRMNLLYGCRREQTAFDFREHLVQKDFCRLSGLADNGWCTHPENGDNGTVGWFIPGTEPRKPCALHGEPPIRGPPADPADPDRIPLFPDDLSDGESPRVREKEDRGFDWGRWFGRRFGSGGSGEDGRNREISPKDPRKPDAPAPDKPPRGSPQDGWLSRFFKENSSIGHDP